MWHNAPPLPYGWATYQLSRAPEAFLPSGTTPQWCTGGLPLPNRALLPTTADQSGKEAGLWGGGQPGILQPQLLNMWFYLSEIRQTCALHGLSFPLKLACCQCQSKVHHLIQSASVHLWNGEESHLVLSIVILLLLLLKHQYIGSDGKCKPLSFPFVIVACHNNLNGGYNYRLLLH